jgi:amino acid transporter
MAEETTDPQRTFPRALLLGLTITGIVYVLVAFFTTAVVPLDVLAQSETDLLEVIRAGAAWFPLGLFALISLCAVSNSALINLMMASRLLYGMAHEGIVPASLGHVHAERRTPWVAILFTTVLAIGLASWGGVRQLGGTTALLLLCVFTLVNVAVLVLRARPVEHAHYRAPTILPVLGAVSSAYLASPWSGRDGSEYEIAGVLLAIGLVLWLVNWLIHGRRRA